MGFFNCHMSSPHSWPSQMDMCQNLIHILLDGQDIFNLLIMMNIEKCLSAMCHHIIELHKLTCVTMGNPNRIM
jgi:hypothetical protein